jgi:hypothetical protein
LGGKNIMLFLFNLPRKMPGEQVLKIIRRDCFILFKKLASAVVLIVLPALAGWMIIKLFPNILVNEFFYPLMLLAVSVYGLFVWLFLFFSFIDYYLDVWIITSERIIDIRQEGFFSRVVSELKVPQIQDVTSEMQGIFQFIFKYGDVYVQTASKVERFVFSQVPHPERIRDIVIKLVEEKKGQGV